MILPQQYKSIQNSINYIFLSQRYIYDQLQQMLQNYNSIENPSVTVSNIIAENQNKISEIYNFIQYGYGYSSIDYSVKTLQEHILKNGKTVDQFLTDNSITVSQDFAKVSSNVGFPINDQNIT